jgi:hypothetical protein
MQIDFTDDERKVVQHALATYVSDLREEITKTEKHEWLDGLRREKDILERVIAQLSVK